MNFDENQWYHLYVGGSKDNAIVGTPLVFGDPNLEDTTKHNTTTGAVFKSTNKINDDEHEQKWQIVAIDSEYYVLRTAASGPNGYLATNYASNRENLTSHTLARMVRDNVSDASIYWKISMWSASTFKFTNKANGTDWPLEIGGESDTDDGTEARINFNVVKATPRREFSFEAIGEVNGTDIGKINNADFSRAAISVGRSSVETCNRDANIYIVTCHDGIKLIVSELYVEFLKSIRYFWSRTVIQHIWWPQHKCQSRHRCRHWWCGTNRTHCARSLPLPKAKTTRRTTSS